MFKDILRKYKGHVEIIIWLLEINGKARGVEVFNLGESNRGTLEGYIKNTTLKVDEYTDYRISIPTPTRNFFKVILERTDKNTIKFYVPRTTVRLNVFRSTVKRVRLKISKVWSSILVSGKTKKNDSK